MASFRDKRRFGLEDGEGEQVDVTELENPVEGVEAKLIEVEGLDREIEDMAADGEALSEDTAQVEQIADAVEDAVEGGEGMDETAARVADVALEHYHEKWGLGRRTSVGNESFGSANTRLRATKAGLESIKDTLVRMWETFVEWLGELINKLRDFWVKYVNAGKALKKRIDKLEERLENGLGTQDKKTISGSFISDLTIDGTFNVGAVEALSSTIDKDTHELIGTIALDLTENSKLVKAGGGVANEGKPVEFGKKTTKAMGSVPNGSTAILAYALPGNTYLLSYKAPVPEGLKDEKGVAVNNGILHTRIVSGGTDKVVTKVDTPDAAKMKSALAAARKFADTMETRITEFRGLQDKMKELQSASKEAVKAMKDVESGNAAIARYTRNKAQAAVANHQNAQKAITGTLKAGGVGLCNYVQAGLAAYKKA